MRRVGWSLAASILGLALLVGASSSQDKKDKDKPKGMLPAGWKKLDLSKEQILKIYDIQGKYKGKIKDLKDQIGELETQERAEMVKILTKDQQELLVKLATGEAKDKKKGEPKKDGDVKKDAPKIEKDKKSDK